MEEIFLESMESKGLKVDRLTHPTSMKLSEKADELADPDIYVARVSPSLRAILYNVSFPSRSRLPCNVQAVT